MELREFPTDPERERETGHHERFHNRNDLYLDSITNDKWHRRGERGLFSHPVIQRASCSLS